MGAMQRAVIPIDGTDNDALSLACAVALCRSMPATLEVVHIRTPSRFRYTGFDSGIGVVDDATTREARRAIARAAFDEVCGELSFARWSESDLDIVELLESLGLLCDLVFLERLTAEEGPGALTFNTVVFGGGCPVLITPPRQSKMPGSVIAVVWSATPSSARAVRAALPLLENAHEVYVLTNTENPRARARDLAAYLAARGINSKPHVFMGNGLTARGRGRAAITAARDVGANLLVFGAHGESGVSALMGLGRATRKIVTAAPMPVLLQA